MEVSAVAQTVLGNGAAGWVDISLSPGFTGFDGKSVCFCPLPDPLQGTTLHLDQFLSKGPKGEDRAKYTDLRVMTAYQKAQGKGAPVQPAAPKAKYAQRVQLAGYLKDSITKDTHRKSKRRQSGVSVLKENSGEVPKPKVPGAHVKYRRMDVGRGSLSAWTSREKKQTKDT